MWSSLWRSGNRFSLQEFKYQINKLQGIKVVDMLNRDLVVDILRSIVEIVTYGDRRDPSIFELFMEHQILAEFLRLLKISRESIIEAQLLHYLSIMIQNLDSEQSIYFCFSNEYINNIILHPYDFDGGDLAVYYVSFLRTISGKLNRDTICLLVKVQENTVVSFPLYTEALKFSQHEEKMIQIAVRALTLSIYNVRDDMVYAFITTPPVSKYFSGFVLNMRQQCFHLDAVVNATKNNNTHIMRKDLLMEADKFIDDLYYCKDILRVGEPRLSRLITHNLLCLLVIPLLLPLLQSYQTKGSQISAVTSLYIISCLLQVVGGKELVNCMVVALLCPCTDFSTSRGRQEISGTNSYGSFLEHLNEFKDHLTATATTDSETAEKSDTNFLSKHLLDHNSSSFCFENLEMDNIQSERNGILRLIFSDSPTLLLASLMLLIFLSESKELDDSLSSMMGVTQKKIRMDETMGQDTCTSSSPAMDGNIFVRHMPWMLIELLKCLVNEPPLSVLTIWNIGWALRKLLSCQEKRLTDHDFELFKISYDKSCRELMREINGHWFDYIPATLKNEWECCKKALDESSQSKDPFFSLEPEMHRYIPDGDISSPLAWKRMVDAVKVFVLHHLLKAFILKGDFLENPLLNLRTSSMSTSGRTLGIDILSANFGTELSLEMGFPCKISFSKGKDKDIFLISMAKGISGKLLLAEKIHFPSHRGVVIAVAPLAGLNPTIDENHPTWLRLQIRDYNPEHGAGKVCRYGSSALGDHAADRRWTLGFLNSEDCRAAQASILKEINKQRSSVKSLLMPFLQCSPNDTSSTGICE